MGVFPPFTQRPALYLKEVRRVWVSDRKQQFNTKTTVNNCHHNHRVRLTTFRIPDAYYAVLLMEDGLLSSRRTTKVSWRLLKLVPRIVCVFVCACMLGIISH